MSEPDYTKKLIEKLDNLEKKLGTLIKLVAITSSIETMKKEPQKKQIKTLSDLGLSRGLIALLVGTTPLTVSVTLSQMKKGKKQKNKGASVGKEENPKTTTKPETEKGITQEVRAEEGKPENESPK